MNKQEILNFINRNPICYLATSHDNIPSVRIMRILKADKNAIMFNTKKFKKSFEELSKNPNIEICFYNEDDDIQIRVFGKAKEIDNLDIKKKIVADFPKLSDLVEKQGYDIITPFILEEWQVKMGKRH